MNEKVREYKDLVVWQKAYSMTLQIYKLTEKYPKHEQYGLTSQIRRAATSVVSNIAEGYARKGRGEYVHFLSIAYASVAEIDTQLLLSRDLGYLPDDEARKLLSLKDEVGTMLFSMQQKLKI